MSARLVVSFGIGAAVAAALWRTVRTEVVPALLQLSAPLVVPIDEPVERVGALGESHPAAPQLAGGRLIVPVENAGLGPAINVRGSLLLSRGGRENASIAVLPPGRRAALVFGTHQALEDFRLRLTFEDWAGRGRHVDASWSLTERTYSVGWPHATFAGSSPPGTSADTNA